MIIIIMFFLLKKEEVGKILVEKLEDKFIKTAEEIQEIINFYNAGLDILKGNIKLWDIKYELF
jgi:hypothetical protein